MPSLQNHDIYFLIARFYDEYSNRSITVPRLVLTVPDTEESVTRPIVFDITRQLLEITGLPENTLIQYPGPIEKVAQVGSQIGYEGDTNRMPFTSRIAIEVEENYEPERMLSTAIYRPENLFIFNDEALETAIKPAYSSTDMTLSFRFRAEDRVSAIRWRDDIRARVSMDRAERIHAITYHYLIPEEFLVILKEIHRLRENVAGYNQDYDTYFNNHVTTRASLLTNQAGKQAAWGISEKQMRIVGWFDFEGVPELGSKEDDGDTWTISFSYKFKFDKPIACVMQYPIMIHNQLLSSKFRNKTVPDNPDYHARSYSLSAKNFSMFEKGREIAGAVLPAGIAIPTYDEFMPESIVQSSKRVFTTLVNIDPALPAFLLSLTDLGDWHFSPEMIAFMKAEAAFMTTPFKSIFSLMLYQGASMVTGGLKVTDALEVLTTRELSLRNYYHIRLGVITDFSLLDRSALDRAREHGKAVIEIFDYIDPSIRARGLIPTLLGGSYMRKIDLDGVMNRSSDTNIYQFNTVATLFIQAYPREENANS